MKSEFAFAFESAGWPALLVDSGTTICRANAAAIKLFGPALEGNSTQLSAIWSPENSGTAEQFLAQWERAPSPTVTLKLRAKGANVLSSWASLCSFNKDGQKYFVLQLLPELTSHQQGTNHSEELNLAHKQKLDCALQLARTVALDFNNALTSILGHTSLVLAHMGPNDPWRGSLLEVEKSAAKAAEIATDLATFSRQDKETPSQPAGNLNLLLQRAADIFQASALAAGIEWKLLLEPKLFTAKFDEAKMQQAFIKILENAMEALGGGGRITIQTRNIELPEQAQDREVRLAAGAHVCGEISDNGRGISPELLPRIFEPFFTTKAGSHRGLGLAWVYGIVTNHGGGVAVSSQPGVGTSVRVYLPAETRIVRDDPLGVQDLSGNQSILMVDDDDLVLTTGRAILSAYGYKVLTANSGQKALDLLAAKESIDLVITDMVMPAMSGRELIEHLHRLAPETRILCVSGYIGPAKQRSDRTYLQKPFAAQELLFKVKQVLAA